MGPCRAADPSRQTWRRQASECHAGGDERRDVYPEHRIKMIKGKKRHVLVDTQGLLLHAIVHSAGVQDRDGGIWLLATLFGQFPFLAKLFADSAYARSIFHTALRQVL